MPAMIDGATYTVAGVRKPPRNEPAGDDRRRRRGLGYGDLAEAEGVCEGPRCAVARAMRRQGGNSSWDWWLGRWLSVAVAGLRWWPHGAV